MIKVVKRDGSVVDFDPSKINSMAEWATAGNESQVNWSDLCMLAFKMLPSDKVTSAQIQQALIKAALDMQTIAYNRVAGRLLLGDIRKTSKASKDFVTFYNDMVSSGYWRKMDYSEQQLKDLAACINHDKDLQYGYPTLRQFIDKYGVKSVEGDLLELPQYAYMGVAMSLFEGCPLSDVVMYYDKASSQKINIPSPVMTGQRTPSNVGVSCVIATGGDSVQGIEAAHHISAIATASSAGLGLEYDVRSPLDDVRKGYAKAGGKLPHYRVLEAKVKELKQQLRGGSATVSFKCIDPEIETLLALKLPRSPEERRIDQLDYSLLWNTTFIRRVAKQQPWPLVSIKDCPELHEMFYGDPDAYEVLIQKVLDDNSVKKVVVNAMTIFKQWVESRSETGRVYRGNVTSFNQHTPFKQTIRLSNLCQEVLLPTLPYNHITELYKPVYEEGDGMTALCFLSAIDVARVTSNKDYEDTAYIVCKSLDLLIDKMDYPFPQWKYTANAYRSIGVGITNLAYALAKNKKKYDDVEYINKIAERHYYYLLKASVRLAKERGCFSWIHKTKWVDGWLPIDTYNRNVDKLTTTLNYDWDVLRSEVMEHGVRFSVLAAHMPCESSSVFGNSINGLYLPQELMTLKDSKSGIFQFYAPDSDKYQYQLCWDVPFNTVVNTYAIVQKWTDQTISADTYTDYTKYADSKVPMTEQVRNYLYADQMGVKTLYYNKFRTGRGQQEVPTEDVGCESCSL